MVEIYPVINVKTYKKFLQRLTVIKNFDTLFQIDFSDGQFCSFKNWADPSKIKEIKEIKRKFEFHLMVDSPEIVIENFLEANPFRVIIHIENIKDFDFLKEICNKNKVELGLALNPYTEIEVLERYLGQGKVNFVLLLGVNPGPSGQNFQWFVLEKVQRLRKKYPKINIELDGGVNEEVLKEGMKAGANIFAVGSYLFEGKDPIKRFKYLKSLTQEN
ncbi:MAG: hypothetical protein ACPLXL_01285 [Minisyncoccia bacterium]